MKTKDGLSVGKKLIIAIAVIAVILLAAYFIIAIYFKSHAFPNTYIQNVSISWKSEDGIEKKINSMLDDYTLTLITREEETESINCADVGLKYITDGYGDELISAQHVLTWPAHLFKKTVYTSEFDIEYDEKLFDDVINGLKCVQNTDVVQPEDAYIADYVSGEGYKIVPEVLGNVIDKDALKKTISDALTNMDKEINLDEKKCYIEPEIYSTDESITEKAAYLNKFTDTRIVYTFGEDEVVVDGDVVHEWMNVSKKGKVTIDETKVRAFVDSLGSKYDTIFRSRKFVTTSGKEITLSEGDYGWWMNRAAETEELIKLVKKGKQENRKPVYFQEAEQYGANDYGNTYVEINLTAQHLYVYKDGSKVLESDFVSGKNTPDRRTPSGVYGITYKERDATLVGEDYETPVSYWMPFNKNVGLHDAIWRNKFGSNFYKAGGSHGCINLPFYVAEKIYNIVEKGTPVICYELAGTESSSVTSQGDKEIAQFVVDAIDRIGDVVPSRKPTLEKTLKRVRDSYNGLTSNQRKYVTNLSKLEKAEKDFKELK